MFALTAIVFSEESAFNMTGGVCSPGFVSLVAGFQWFRRCFVCAYGVERRGLRSSGSWRESNVVMGRGGISREADVRQEAASLALCV